MSKERKKAGAMRIFEALSAVDEELLVRCEESDAAPVASNKIKPFWYYGKVMAACLCFVIMGALVWRVGPMLSKNAVTESAMDSDSNMAGAQESALIEKAAMAEAAPAEGVDSAPQAPAAMAEGSVMTEEKATGEAGVKQEMDSGVNTQELESAVTEGCPVDTREQLTEEEVRAESEMGQYIPTSLPDGYVFEAAYRQETEAGATQSVSVTWCKGMDSISWSVSRADMSVVTVTDISKPETYDVHLYEIPYGSTVPEEYRTQFSNPVFADVDFSKELVQARMKVVVEQGDTATPRGDFSVLYEEGIIVRFNGRGDVDSIYEMFQSIR